MIALPSDLPLLQVGRYELMAYEADWLEEAIKEAAEAAGHENWWFASDITRSVMMFLRNNYAGTSVTLEYLNRRIRQVLQQVGFQDISNHVNLTPPQVNLSLHDMAVEAE